MEIKLAKIDRTQIPFFESMDPFYMLERTVLPQYFAYAAAIPGTGDEEDLPVGLLVGSLSGDTVYVNWLYVAEGYRGEGIGEKLLVQVIEGAQKAGIATVTACFDSRTDRDDICFQEEEYFKERDFSQWIPLEDEWETSVRTILNRCSDNTGDGMKLEALSDYPKEEQLEIIRECLGTPDGMENSPFTAEGIDPDISFYSDYKGKEIVCLFAGYENVVFPLFLSDTADKGKDALLGAALSAIKKKYGPDTLVVMRRDDQMSDFPDWMSDKKSRIDRWGLLTVIL